MAVGNGKLVVRLDAIGRGTVTLDGFELSKYSNAIHIESRVGEATRVSVDLISVNVDVEVAMEQASPQVVASSVGPLLPDGRRAISMAGLPAPEIPNG